jgi:lipopolysaccharide exporter
MKTGHIQNHSRPQPLSFQSAAPKEGFGLHVRKLLTGTSLAQAIGLVFSPLLTRLYAPEQFGFLALFLSTSTILSLAASLNYEPGIMLPDGEDEAWTLALLCVLLVAASTGVSFFPLALFRHEIAGILGSPGFAPYLLWIPPAIFLLSINRVLEMWLSRWIKYTELAGTKVAGAASGALAKLGLGFSPWGFSGGLILGTLVCEAGKIVWAAPAIKKTLGQVRFLLNNWKAVLAAHKNFPRYSFGASILEFVGYAVPVYVIAHVFGPKVLGFYDLGLRMVAAPLELVVHGVRQVFYQKSVADLKSRGEIATLVEETSSRLIALGFVPFLLLGFAGSSLFSFAFGADWAKAGLFAQLLSPALFFRYVATPTLIFNTLNRQSLYLAWQALHFTVTCIVLVLSGRLHDEVITVGLLSISSCMTHVLLIGLNLKLSGASIKRILFIRCWNLTLDFRRK